VEEVLALLAENLEAEETGAFSRDNGLLTFAADDDRPESTAHLPTLLVFLCRTARLIAFPEPYRLSVNELVQGPRRRRALQPSDSSRARIRSVALANQFFCQLLLLTAEEEVVGAIRHQYLVTHIGGG
jgi:hypothetical protein